MPERQNAGLLPSCSALLMTKITDAASQGAKGDLAGATRRLGRGPPTANKRVQFGYGLNYLIDIKHAVIVDVEASPARSLR